MLNGEFINEQAAAFAERLREGAPATLAGAGAPGHPADDAAATPTRRRGRARTWRSCSELQAKHKLDDGDGAAAVLPAGAEPERVRVPGLTSDADCHDARIVHDHDRQFCGRTRREFLWETGGGFTGRRPDRPARRRRLLRPQAARPTARRRSSTRSRRRRRTSPPKAKSVIFLFMYGGPSHIDTFDYKPKLYRLDGKTITVKTFGRGGHKNEGRIVEPKWKFKQYGQCGKWVSDLFPHLGDVRRRHRVPALDERRVADPRLGHADDELRPDPQRQPVPGLVGELRPGQREREPARLRRHARPDRRADQRAEELVERLHAGHLPGRRSSAPTSTPILDLAPPAGHDAATPSGGCSTRCARRTSEHLRRAGRQHRAGRPHRQLRAGLQDAAARPRGGRLQPRRRRRRRSCTASTSRGRADFGRQVPAGPPAGRARRAVHPDLLRRRPQRRQLGRPQATWSRTTTSTPARPTSRSPGCSRT